MSFASCQKTLLFARESDFVLFRERMAPPSPSMIRAPGTSSENAAGLPPSFAATFTPFSNVPPSASAAFTEPSNFTCASVEPAGNLPIDMPSPQRNSCGSSARSVTRTESTQPLKL